MTIYLVRHGKAGDRSKWDGPDDLRPLSKAGRRQADALAEQLAARPVERVFTSPAVRCRQTVQPLAERIGLAVELADALVEGAPLEESVALLDKVIDHHTVLSTHGDVVANLLRHFERLGVRIGEHQMQKGSVWVFETEAGAVVSAHYEPPPE